MCNYIIGYKCQFSHDFQEGCKAKLNRKYPQYYPKKLKGVDLEIDIYNDRFDILNILNILVLVV